jgi:uncharacterized protein
MAIKIKDIPPEGLTIDIADSLSLFDEGNAATPFRATVTIRPEGQGIFHVSGTVEAAAELECSRCLKRFPFPVRDAVMDFDLLPESSLQKAAERELGRSELETEFYRNDEIEPADFIREQILLAVPMVPVHREDCKGLCPLCGADRNERSCSCEQQSAPEKEHPFAALRKIIKPEKE